MRKEYTEELEQLKTKMEKAERFAEALPVFAKKILDGKITGEDHWIKFGDTYKKIYLAWGINRGFYRNGGPRYIMNCPKDRVYSLHLFNIYVNTISLFDERHDFGLYDYLKGVDVFFTDELNSTFYVTDSNVEAFLEALNTWFCDAIEKLKKHRLQEQEAELKRKLEETQNQIKQNVA
jgi:hypothetical protein